MWPPLASMTARTRRTKLEQALTTSAVVKVAMFFFTEVLRAARLLCGFLLTFLLSSDHN